MNRRTRRFPLAALGLCLTAALTAHAADDAAKAQEHLKAAVTLLGKRMDYAGAVKELTKAVKLNPNLAEAFTLRGQANAKLGNQDDALADFTEALRLNPRDAKALEGRAAIREKQGAKRLAEQDRAEAARFRADRNAEPLATLIARLAASATADREKAAAEVEKVGKAALPALREAFADQAAFPAGSPQRALCAALLLKAGDASAPAVEAWLADLRGGDAKARLAALQALNRPIGGLAAVQALAEILKDRDPRVRAAAVTALGQYGRTAETAVPAVVAALKDEAVPVRLAAADLLTQFTPPEAGTVAALRASLADAAPTVRLAAVAALRRLGEKAQPTVPTTAVYHLGSAMKAAGYPLGLPLLREPQPIPAGRPGFTDHRWLEGFVRFGPMSLAKGFYTGDQFAKLEAEQKSQNREDFIATQVFSLNRLSVRVPARDDFADNGLFVITLLPFRLEVEKDPKDTLTPNLKQVYPSWPYLGEFWFLTKTGRLQRPNNLQEVDYLLKNGGIAYHPEARTTEMYFNLDVDLALAKRITRNSKEFVMDVMFDGLTYREIDVWGYYRRSALFNQNWNTNVLHAHHDAGADIGMEVPEYFEPDTASRPSLVHARLIQAVLKDAEGKEIAAYRKPTAYGDLVPVTGAPEEEGARPPQPKAPDKKALLRNGQELAQGGEFAKAVQALTEAQRLDPKDKTILWHRGNAYRQLGDLAKAISDFDAAIGLDPKYARAYLSRSKAYEQQGDKERAAADRDKALQLNPALGKDKDGG